MTRKLNKDTIETAVSSFLNKLFRYSDQSRAIVTFGAALVLQGIREKTEDIDIVIPTSYLMLVTDLIEDGTFKRKDGDMQLYKFRTKVIYNDIEFDIHFGSESWMESLMGEHGYMVQTLESILFKKREWNREKDQDDIRLLEEKLFGISTTPRPYRQVDQAPQESYVPTNPDPDVEAVILKIRGLVQEHRVKLAKAVLREDGQGIDQAMRSLATQTEILKALGG